ncbi:Six-hairpin glycosidase-like protein [Aspergillus caelatus]|uniref:Six-hairpin glycosidase-like protein n=1 Tax=Aspergillus caelatus TaxID=61420 RepID=A0A5N7AJ77_9EURO|nr:Six-hairpin glycosidase-like protein [Aspergillus caelatus]KAE8369937.1 Six-hairpin glycosidase-like protein [Aspergillus caelatus]
MILRRNIFCVISAGLLASPVFCDDTFTPVGVVVGDQPELSTNDFAAFALDPQSPLATVDYGAERAGYPFFVISSLSQPVQLEVKYSEEFNGLDHPFSDGPYSFSNQLGNSFRVETFNITRTGRVTSSLVQGGQRWQSIRLLTSGTVTLSEVGFDATIDTVEPENLPGQFSCDDDVLNEIWKLGARAATAACVDKQSQKAIWEVDPVNGVFTRSVRPSVSVNGTAFANYTLEFETMIEKGGSWWSVASPMAGSAYTMMLTGELPEASRLANVNATLTPSNTISLAYGVDFVNQTTLTTWVLDVFEVPFAVRENTWYKVSVSLSPSGYLSASLNDRQIFNISKAAYPLATGEFSGSFGFGAYQDHAAYFRNVNVYDTETGSTLYTNSLTTEDVLAEYGTQANQESLCLDGPKRDRLVWLGDFIHTARILGVSTSRIDHARGTLQYLLDSQIDDGELAISPNIGYNMKASPNSFAPTGSYYLSDYQLLGLISFHDFVQWSGDLAWAKTTWPKWQKQIDWIIGKVNNTTGLISFNAGAFIGPQDGGSAVACAAVQALTGAAEVATALGDTKSASRYQRVAASIANAVNKNLWNDQLGAYSSSIDDIGNFSVSGTAYCISSGVASSNQTARSLATLSGLRLGPGYKDSSDVSDSDPTVNISPNTNGFLLPALFKANATNMGLQLIKNLWSVMLPLDESQNRTAVGTSWEYVNAQTHQPGLSLFTSLSHPWGGAPTYILTEWAAGLRPAQGPDGFGYRKWIIAPETGFQIGLKRAQAKVVTAFDGSLSVEWHVQDGKLHANIMAPTSTEGQFVFRGRTIQLSGKASYNVSVSVY